MRYNEPYGGAADAPYVNGDPSIGRAGSIPPAASIEYPQREIANFVTDAGLVPSNADLHQLAKAVQNSKVIYARDNGVANALQITLTPAIAALTEGMTFLVRVLAQNTGPATINVNATGAVAIVHPTDFSPLAPLELNPNSIVCLVFDGVRFQLAWSQSRVLGGPIYLTQAQVFYVNGATGSDTYDGLTAAVTTGIHGPFKTLQKAADTMTAFNLNGFNITVNVSDNTYAPVVLPNTAGSGSINFVGNVATPTNCVISAVNTSSVSMTNGGSYTFDGFKVQASGASSVDGIIGFTVNRGTVGIGAINFGTCVGAHIQISQGGIVYNKTPACMWTLSGGCAGNSFITGCFMSCFANGLYQNNAAGAPNLTISTPITFAGSFVDAHFNSLLMLTFGTITNPANVTGKRYYADTNANIWSGGGGINYFPGTIAGTVATGGQYT